MQLSFLAEQLVAHQVAGRDFPEAQGIPSQNVIECGGRPADA